MESQKTAGGSAETESFRIPESLGAVLSGETPLQILRVSGALGQASFPMKHGSFRYIDRIRQKRLMYRVESEDSLKKTLNAEKTCVYAGESGREYCLRLTLNEEQMNRLFVTFRIGPEEHFYGLGETFSEFDLRGLKGRVWVAEHQNADRIAKKLIREKFFGKQPKHKSRFAAYESYYVQPTLVSSAHYYLHADTGAFSSFDLSKEGELTVEFRESCCLYFGRADSFEALSGLLSTRLGRQKKLPDWCHDGMILGIQQGPEVINEKIRKCREAGVPVTGIWSQDWCGCRRTGFGYQVMWNWEYDRELYPELPERIREWKAEGIRFLGYINPFMAIEKELYAYASSRGYCVKAKDGSDYLVTITTFPAAMIDLTNPEAYAWYKKIIKENLIGIGMSGWMADFGEYLPVDAVLYSGEDAEKLHNRWPAIWARLNREAVEECGLTDEILFFTRAGYSGTPSESRMMWTGDQHVDWSLDDGIGSVIPATLSLAMSGYGLTHSDVGGYTTMMKMTRSRELLLRWAEMNAFSPLMRSHEGNQPSRNVQFDADEALLKQLGASVRTFVRLKPYLKECEEELESKGIPVMRPLFYHYEEEAAFTEKFEYLLGRDLLVCPVIEEGARTRLCYLPDDRWIRLSDGRVCGGGLHEVEAPLGDPAVFIRADHSRALDVFLE